jgi:archaellum component FlaC
MWFFGISTLIAMLFKLDKLAPLCVKAFLTMTLIKFSMVLIIVVNGYVDQTFIQQDVQAAMAKTQGIEDQLRREASKLPKSASTEQNATWTQEKEMLKAEQQRLIEQQRQHQDQLPALKANATQIQQQIDERNAQTAITDRVKKIWQNDELDQQLSKLKTDISAIESLIHNDSKGLTRIKDDLQRLDNLINGKPNGWVDTVAQQTKGMMDKAVQSVPTIPSLDQLKNQLEETASSLVNLMAMFVIKSIVMPMLFLYMLFILNKLLWRFDLQMFQPRRQIMKH